jgi:hypothetical protein
MINKFITYKEDLNGFDQTVQDQILKGCLYSWQQKKFNTQLLSRKDAESHPLFKDLLKACKKHCKVTDTTDKLYAEKIQFHSEASIIRWLAFANSKAENFFLGDYDIFNLGVMPEDVVYKNLTFLNGQCLCFSYVENWKWAEFLAEIFIKNIDIMTNWNEAHVFYHDQDLVVQLCKHNLNIFTENGITFENILLQEPTDGNIPKDCKLLHVSHFSHKSLEKKFGDRELARLNTVNEILKLIS